MGDPERRRPIDRTGPSFIGAWHDARRVVGDLLGFLDRRALGEIQPAGVRALGSSHGAVVQPLEIAPPLLDGVSITVAYSVVQPGDPAAGASDFTARALPEASVGRDGVAAATSPSCSEVKALSRGLIA